MHGPMLDKSPPCSFASRHPGDCINQRLPAPPSLPGLAAFPKRLAAAQDARFPSQGKRRAGRRRGRRSAAGSLLASDRRDPHRTPIFPGISGAGRGRGSPPGRDSGRRVLTAAPRRSRGLCRFLRERRPALLLFFPRGLADPALEKSRRAHRDMRVRQSPDPESAKRSKSLRVCCRRFIAPPHALARPPGTPRAHYSWWLVHPGPTEGCI